MDVNKLRLAIMNALNQVSCTAVCPWPAGTPNLNKMVSHIDLCDICYFQGLPSDIDLVREAKHFVADLEELAKYEDAHEMEPVDSIKAEVAGEWYTNAHNASFIFYLSWQKSPKVEKYMNKTLHVSIAYQGNLHLPNLSYFIF